MIYKVSHVYHHLRASDLSLFYIGKGSERRPYERNRRSKYWQNTVKKHGLIVVIVATFLTEEEAYNEEHRQISLALNIKCRLVNRTLGGLQEIPLVATRKKMAKAARERIQPIRTEQWNFNISKANKGKKRSEEHKKQTSLRQKEYCKKYGNQFLGKKHKESTKIKLSKPVYCVTNDTYYLSQKYAAEDLNISKGHINQVCKGKRNHTYGYKFQYI